MASYSEIGKHLGVTKTQVFRYVHQGMPTESVEKAQEWVRNKPKKRRSTNPGQIAREMGMAAPVAGKGRKAKTKVKRQGVSKSGDSLLDALNNTILISDTAFDLVQDAMADGNLSYLPTLVGIHNKAIEARYAAEEAHRKEMERRKLLININDAIAEYRKGFDFLLTRLRALPQAKAGEINPDNPLHAFKVLDASINDIIGDAQKLYARQQNDT